MECGRMWRGLVEQFPNRTLPCRVLRFVFRLAALCGFLGNTKYCGILLVPKKSFYATSESCLCILCLLPLGRLSFRLSCRGELCGDRGRGKFLCQLPVLSCVLHSLPTAQYAQRFCKPRCSSCERPPVSCSACWPDNGIYKLQIFSSYYLS